MSRMTRTESIEMNYKRLYLGGLLSVLIISEIIWVRMNLDHFLPVLENSTLFFQLILAGTIIAIMRNVVGVKTFGVFGPAIIAFGIIEIGLITGLALYMDVFLIAMVASLFLHELNISAAHRMAVVIAVSAMSITLMELLGELFHIPVLEMSIFFPVLITSWLGDRFVIQVKEIDWIVPSKKLLGTFFVVALSYWFISLKGLVLFFVLNPETWGALILLNILIAWKVDFRLSELLRFQGLFGNSASRKDVLSMNQRNRDLVAKYNPRNLFPHLAKDKMKGALHQLGIATPETFFMVAARTDVSQALELMKKKKDFVIKPSNGYGGEGILVVSRKGKDFEVGGKKTDLEYLKKHLFKILDGQYSTNWSDVALIEQKVVTHDFLREYYWKGVPDLRVILLEGFPIMAMARLPTKESGGAANMHKGAVGMGLTISEGKGMNPFWRGHGGSIEKHPDTGADLKSFRMKWWREILDLSSRAQGASRMGYVGVDVVVDTSGPMILEVNKRPGLEIQNTNMSGLGKRISRVERDLHLNRFISPDKKIDLAMKWDREGWN